MTPTERLQAKWPKLRIIVAENFFETGWLWGAFGGRKGASPFYITGSHEDYKSERGACQSCNCALKAIRKAVT